MSRKKKTLLNVVVSLVKLTLYTLLALPVSREIISYYGSSVNGVIATASQTTVLLQILEGGFTIATLVALFKPFVQKDFDKFNRLLSVTAAAFKKLAVIALTVGLSISIIYPCFINADLAYWKCVLIFFMITVSTVLNFAFFQPRIIAFFVAQKEYVVQSNTMAFNTLSQLTMLLLVLLHCDVLWLRFAVMLILAAKGVCICFLAKREFPFMRLDVPSEGEKIHGTGDVLIGNIITALYAAGPIFMIAVMFGTVAASVFSVYNMFFSLISNTMYVIAIAPKSAFGQLMYDGEGAAGRKFKDLFGAFETVVMGLQTISYATAFVVVLPLLALYTSKMSDSACYINPFYALCFSLLGFSQNIHVPAELLLQVGSRFKAIRNIQIVVLITMLVCGCVGAKLWGMQGMLCGIIVANCVRVSCEVFCAYRNILNKKLTLFLMKLVLMVLFGIGIAALEMQIKLPLPTWGSALGFAAGVAALNALAVGVLAYVLIPRGAINVIFHKLHES